MKKIIILITGVLFLISCDKKTEIKYEMTVSIDVLDVVKNLRSLDNTELFPNGVIDDGSHVRVKLFTFNGDGSLFAEDSQILDDFSQKALVKRSMPEGEYTLVAFADMVDNNGDNITFQCWDFQNTSSLRNFRIVDLGYKGHKYKAMGVSKTNVDISKSLSTNINVQPVGALVTFYFRNLFINEVAFLYYFWDKHADYYLVEDGTSNSVDIDIENEYEVEAEYNGLYDQRYFLPVRDMTLTWATLTGDLNVVKRNTVTFNVEQGKDITVNVDTKAATANVSQTTRSDSFSLDDLLRNQVSTNKKDR
jgi:hypothetical protein